MEERLEELMARCGRMDKSEEEAVKRRWLELPPPAIWEMTPDFAELVERYGGRIVQLAAGQIVQSATAQLPVPGKVQSAAGSSAAKGGFSNDWKNCPRSR